MNFDVNVFAFIRDSLLLLVAWLLLACAFHSWGSILTKLVGINFSGYKKHIANIWLGWCLSLFFWAVYHLLWPINSIASCIFYLPGIVCFFIRYGRKIPAYVRSVGALKVSVIILVLFAASTIAIQVPMNYDTGLYHLNSIRWANEHHIIKGIGNIHTRLGLNQLYFLYAASLNFHPFLNDCAFHAANSFLYALFAVGCVMGGTIVDLLLLCLFFYLPMPYYWIANPTPDIASTLLQIMAFRYFLEAVRNPHPSRFACHLPLKENGLAVAVPNPQSPTPNPIPPKEESYIAFAAILSAVLITVKLSNIVFAIGLGLITILASLRKAFQADDKKVIGRAFVFIGLFFALWVCRGYIQSGYPAFPSDIGGIKFDWSVPKRLANYTENCVYCGSRTNGQVYDPNSPIFKESWAWLDFWVKWNFFDEKEYLCDDWMSNLVTWLTLIFVPMVIFNWGMGSVTLFILSICLFVVWLRAVFKHKGVWEKTSYLFCLQLVGLASILFWFFVAPEVRFANGSFIVYFIASLLLVKTAYSGMTLKKEFKLGLMFFPIIMFIWAFWLGYNVNAFRLDGMIPLKKVPMKTFVTDSGVKLLVPVLSDQCWDSEIPSTPEPEKGLEMRGPSIDDGFRIRE